MITATIDFLLSIQLLINFLACSTVFMGAFYIALQNRNLPSWHVTPLWYVGLSAMFVAMSIVLQGMFGRDFELSYAQVGILGETALNLSLAGIALIMMIGTIRQDLRQRKNRK